MANPLTYWTLPFIPLRPLMTDFSSLPLLIVTLDLPSSWQTSTMSMASQAMGDIVQMFDRDPFTSVGR